MSYQSKECCLCKKKFVLNSPTQKYCEGCRPIIVKEQNRQRCKHWYFKHPDEAKKRIKQCRENNPEKYKEIDKHWAKNHPDRNREKAKRWAKANPGKIREMYKNWYLNNLGKVIEYCKQWKENNPEKYKETQKRMKSKRRYLGFIPLNKYEENFESHHIDKINVIYMPKETHRSIFHNIWTGRNMDVINDLARNYLNYENSIPATS